MIFTFDGTAWHGELETPGLCMGVKGYRVVSEIHLLGDKLHSRDQGYNDRDEMVWGSELLYKFIRLGDCTSGRNYSFTPNRSLVRFQYLPCQIAMTSNETS